MPPRTCDLLVLPGRGETRRVHGLDRLPIVGPAPLRGLAAWVQKRDGLALDFGEVLLRKDLRGLKASKRGKLVGRLGPFHRERGACTGDTESHGKCECFDDRPPVINEALIPRSLS